VLPTSTTYSADFWIKNEISKKTKIKKEHRRNTDAHVSRDLRARRCIKQQCTKQASFKAPGTKKKMFCAAHRPAGYVEGLSY
jgi:hypothetical protein